MGAWEMFLASSRLIHYNRRLSTITIYRRENMSPFADLPCWVIMNCAEDKKCPAKENESQDCWEIFSEVDKRTFNICQDCIVFLSRQKISAISRSEMEQIMNNKGIDVSASVACVASQVES